MRSSLKGLVAALAALLTIAALLAPMAATPVAAQEGEPGAASVSLDAIGPIPNVGQPIPVVLTVRSQRASRGVVDISLRGGPGLMTYVIPVDLPANTPVEVPLLLPASWDGLNATATLRIDGQEPVGDEVREFSQGHEQVVGTLGVTATGLSVPIQIGGGTAILRPLTSDVVSTLGLAGVGTVVTTPAAVRDLSELGRETLLGWVASGGSLDVVGADNALNELLPAEWQNRQQVGRGQLRYVGNDWESSIVPATLGAMSNQESLLGEAAFDFDRSPINDLARDAGLALPSARVVTLLLGIYILLAGPIAYALLRRTDRLRLAWVVLPALALVFTIAGVAVGAGVRSGRSDSHVTIVEVQPVGSSADTTVLVTASLRGSRDLALPAGWTVSAPSDLGNGGSSSALTIRPDRNRTDVTMDLDAGGAGVVSARGPAPDFDNAVVISDVRLSGDVISGRVTNNLGVDIKDVLVFAGHEVQSVDNVGAGDTVNFEVTFDGTPNRSAAEFNRDGWRLQRFWDNGEEPNEITNAGAWAAWRVLDGWNTFAPGTVSVVGWTRDLNAPVGDVDSGRTALVARAVVPDDPNTAGPDAAAVDVQVVPGDRNDFGAPGAGMPEFFGEHFVTVIEASLGQPLVEVSAEVAAAEVWMDGDWQPIALEGDGADTFLLPERATTDGRLWVRSWIPEWNWPMKPGVSVSSSAVGAREAAVGGDFSPRESGNFADPEPFGPGGDASIDEIIEVPALVVDQTLIVDGEIFGNVFDVYTVFLEQGQELDVFLRSDANDSYLKVLDPDGLVAAENDDFRVCCDSGVTVMATQAGEYQIEARDLGNFANGPYSLELTLR